MHKIHKDDVTAVILAGGKGSRLGGQDKGLVEFKGKRLIEYVLDCIGPQVGAVLINANRHLSEYEKYKQAVVADKLEDFQGPLAGIAAAMAKAATPYIVTMPCDGPFLPGDYVARLVKAAEDHNSEIAVAHDGKRIQPIHALLPVRYLGDLENFMRSGKRGVYQWLEQFEVALADFSDCSSCFDNINEDYQRKEWEQERT